MVMVAKTNRGRVWRMFITAVLVLLAIRLVTGDGPAPTPVAFAAAGTFEEATAASRRSGMPVLAFVTADWCPSCQSLKRGGLADEGVARWIADNTHPVLIDADAQREVAAGLNVSGIPALILLRDGREISRSVGASSAAALRGWLAEHGGPVADMRGESPKDGETDLRPRDDGK